MPISDDVLLVHGDCFDVMPKIPEGTADMVFCDLPYAHINANGKLRRCTANEWDSPIDLSKLWKAVAQAAKPRAPFVFTATQPFATHLISSNLDMFRYDLVWKKRSATGFLNAQKAPLRNFELILIFYRQQPTYCPQKTYGHNPWKKGASANVKNNYRPGLRNAAEINDGSRYPLAVLEGLPESDLRGFRQKRLLHPTQKPVALLEWLIKTYTNPGDLVLDPCSGSGTTAIAALNTGRRAICIEKDPGYHAAAVKRLIEARQAPKQAVLPL